MPDAGHKDSSASFFYLSVEWCADQNLTVGLR